MPFAIAETISFPRAASGGGGDDDDVMLIANSYSQIETHSFFAFRIESKTKSNKLESLCNFWLGRGWGCNAMRCGEGWFGWLCFSQLPDSHFSPIC